ncbi:MAG TPA: ADOP family duplicated permease [Vicinamibacterales bacterium]|nr:ADOP family duplicated permease [Vicinamibacterales bacterium]
MAIIGEWIRRLDYLLRRRALEDELRREMESHRAEMGEPASFGNTLRLREDARDAWGWRWLDDLVQDTRFAWRTLRHSPAFALTAIVTLALGIGVNIGMLTLINGLLFRPLYAAADEVVEVDSDGNAARDFSYPNYRDIQEGTADTFSNLAAFAPAFVGLDAGLGPRQALAAAVTANYFQVFGTPVAYGRSFTLEEERPGAGIRVAIISHSLREQLGGDPGTLDPLVRINGEQFTVVGVAPEGFTGTSIPGPEVFLPLGAFQIFKTEDPTGPAFGLREAHALEVVGRLRPGVSDETANAALAEVGRRLAQSFPSVNAGYSLDMSRPSGRLMFMPGAGAGTTAGLTLLLMLMPVVVLLVACLNLADLLLARGHLRRQELAVRSSLGGGRSRLIRQLLTEGLLLALAGGAIGLWLSTWTTDALLRWLRAVLPVAVSLPDATLDWRVLLGTIAFCLLATLIFGAWPAWAQTRRAAAVDLKRQAGDERGVRIGSVLVIGQIALSLLLLSSGGLFMMSVIKAATADPGFRLDDGVLVQIDPGLAGFNEARGRQAHLALVDRLRTVPGVEAVTIGSNFPFSGFSDSREVAAVGAAAESRNVGAIFTVIGREYARVLGLPQLAGRDFTDSEVSSGRGERVAIIDQKLAEELWPGQFALGRLIQFADDERAEGAVAPPPLRVVGIIPAVNHSLGDPRPFPHVYVPLGQHYVSAMTLQLRLSGGQAERGMLDTIARVVRDVDERVPILSVATWRDHLDTSLDVLVYRAGAIVFSAFGGIALLLAVLGVYGVKSYVVSRRMREFGIRIAIGAEPRALLWQVLREGGRVTAIGIGIGLVLALLAGQFLQGILYGVNAAEPLVLVTAPLILLAASLLASYVPALRATRVDPTVALRSE